MTERSDEIHPTNLYLNKPGFGYVNSGVDHHEHVVGMIN